MRTNELAVLLKDKVIKFADENDGLDCELGENKSIYSYKIYGKLLAIEFVYTKKEKLFAPASTLFCRIYLNKNNYFPYHFPELMDELNLDDFRSWYFPHIENEQRLNDCFETLAGMIKEYLPKIYELAIDVTKRKEVEKSMLDERLRILNLKESDVPEDDNEIFLMRIAGLCENRFLMCLASNSAYNCFVEGKYEKAIKQYEKLIKNDSITRYEKRIYIFMKNSLNDNGEIYEAMPLKCNAESMAKTHNSSKEYVVEVGAYIGVGYVAMTIFFMEIIFLYNIFSGLNSIYMAGMKWYWGFIWGVLPGMFFGIAFRRKIAGVFIKKKAQEILDFDDIFNSNATNKLAKGACYVTFVLSLVAVVAILHMNVRFYSDHLIYASGESVFSKPERYEYSDIEEIYCVEGRYNDWDEWIDRGSYILKIKDGTLIDLDEFASKKETEKRIIPIIDEFVPDIKYVKYISRE